MSCESPTPGLTICHDTPANWLEFYTLKDQVGRLTPEDLDHVRRLNPNHRLLSPQKTQLSPSATGAALSRQQFNLALQARVASENRWLRSLSASQPKRKGWLRRHDDHPYAE